jgi:hypothetical protein
VRRGQQRLAYFSPPSHSVWCKKIDRHRSRVEVSLAVWRDAWLALSVQGPVATLVRQAGIGATSREVRLPHRCCAAAAAGFQWCPRRSDSRAATLKSWRGRLVGILKYIGTADARDDSTYFQPRALLAGVPAESFHSACCNGDNKEREKCRTLAFLSH